MTSLNIALARPAKMTPVFQSSVEVFPEFSIEEMVINPAERITKVDKIAKRIIFPPDLIKQQYSVALKFRGIGELPERSGDLPYFLAEIFTEKIPNAFRKTRSMLALQGIYQLFKIKNHLVPYKLYSRDIIIPVTYEIVVSESKVEYKILMLRQYITGYYEMGFYPITHKILQNAVVLKAKPDLMDYKY